MNSEKKQDILIREKLKNYQADVENSGWIEFSGKYQLVRTKRKRRIVYWTVLFIFSIGLIFGTLISPKKDLNVRSAQQLLPKDEIIENIVAGEFVKKPKHSKIDDIENKSSQILSTHKTLTGTEILNEKIKQQETPIEALAKPIAAIEDTGQSTFTLKISIKSDSLLVLNDTYKNVQAPDNINNTHQKTSHFSISFNLSPEYSFQKFSVNQEYIPQIHEDYEIIRLNSESGRYSFSAGINLNWYPVKNLSIKSGLFYSDFAENVNYNFSNHKIPVIDSATNNIIAYLTDSFGINQIYSGKNNISYLGIPLVFGYDFNLNPKLSIRLEAGTVLFLNVAASGKSITQNTLELINLEKSDYTNLSVGIIGSAGILYNISDKLIIGLSPTYKHFISNSLNNDGLTSSPSAIEIKILFEIKL